MMMHRLHRYSSAGRWAAAVSGLRLWIDAAHPSGYTTGTASITNGSSIDNAAWTKSEMTVTANNDGTAELLATNIANPGPGTAIVSQAITGAQEQSAGAVPLLFSGQFRPNTASWLYIGLSSASTDRIYVNVSTGAVGTTGSNISNVAVSVADGDGYRTVTFQANALGATPTVRIAIAEADGDSSIAFGVNLSLWAKNIGVSQALVTGVSDLSAPGTSITQGTVNNQPGYEYLSGYPSLRFYGLGASGTTQQYLQSTDSRHVNVFAGDDLPYSLFCVAKYNGTPSGNDFFVTAGDVGAAFPRVTPMSIQNTSGNRFVIDKVSNGNTADIDSGGLADTNRHVFDMVHSGTVVSMRVDGTTQITSATQNVPTCSNIDNLTLGGLSSAATPRFCVNANLHELLIYNRVLSNAEVSYIRKRLGRKWGISVA